MTWPTLIFSPSLTRTVFHHAVDGRRNFDDRFVGFQLHHWLAFGDFGAGRNHQAHQIALRDVLAEFGQFEFLGALAASLTRRPVERGGAASTFDAGWTTAGAAFPGAADWTLPRLRSLPVSAKGPPATWRRLRSPR